MPNLALRHSLGNSNSSRFFHSPRKCSGHSFAGSVGVGLLVKHPEGFRVNAHKQLRNTLSRKARLDVNNSAVVQHLSMCSVMKFTVGPQPKCRSAMWHLFQPPFVNAPYESQARPFKYVQSFEESIRSHKRYRCNVLASKPSDVFWVPHG